MLKPETYENVRGSPGEAAASRIVEIAGNFPIECYWAKVGFYENVRGSRELPNLALLN